VWINGQIQVVPRPKQHESFVQHAHEELGHLGIQFTQFVPNTIMVAKDAIANSIVCLSMYGM
jgi:hypothetical protein